MSSCFNSVDAHECMKLCVTGDLHFAVFVEVETGSGYADTLGQLQTEERND